MKLEKVFFKVFLPLISCMLIFWFVSFLLIDILHSFTKVICLFLCTWTLHALFFFLRKIYIVRKAGTFFLIIFFLIVFVAS